MRPSTTNISIADTQANKPTKRRTNYADHNHHIVRNVRKSLGKLSELILPYRLSCIDRFAYWEGAADKPLAPLCCVAEAATENPSEGMESLNLRFSSWYPETKLISAKWAAAGSMYAFHRLDMSTYAIGKLSTLAALYLPIPTERRSRTSGRHYQ